MLKKYQLIIWDWNGTLLDDVWLCVDIMNGMLAKRNLSTIDQQTYQQIFDFPVQGYYEKTGFDFTLESFADANLEYGQEYIRRVNECSLQEGATELIKALHKNNTRQVVLSAAEQNMLDTMVNEFELASFFKQVHGQDNFLAQGKIEKGLKILEQEKIKPEQAVLVGDTFHDHEVAQALGIDCILVSNGHHHLSKLEKTDANLIEHLGELF